MSAWTSRYSVKMTARHPLPAARLEVREQRVALDAAPLARLAVSGQRHRQREARLAAAAHAVDAVGAPGEHGLVLGPLRRGLLQRHGRHDLVGQRERDGAADALRLRVPDHARPQRGDELARVRPSSPSRSGTSWSRAPGLRGLLVDDIGLRHQVSGRALERRARDGPLVRGPEVVDVAASYRARWHSSMMTRWNMMPSAMSAFPKRLSV